MLTEEGYNDLKLRYGERYPVFVEEVRSQCSGSIQNNLRSVVYKLLLLGFPPTPTTDMEELNLNRYSLGVAKIKEIYGGNKKPAATKYVQSLLHHHFSPYYLSSDVFEDLQKDTNQDEAVFMSFAQYVPSKSQSDVDISEFNIFGEVFNNKNIDPTLGKYLVQIAKDVPRIDENLKTLSGLDVTSIYYNILTIYCILNQNAKENPFTQGNDRLLSALVKLFFDSDYKDGDKCSICKVQVNAYYCFAKIMNVVEIENTRTWKDSLHMSVNIVEARDKELGIFLGKKSVPIEAFMVKSFVSFFVETFEIDVWYRFFDWVLSKNCNNIVRVLECFGAAYIIHFRDGFLSCSNLEEYLNFCRDKFQNKELISLEDILGILEMADEILEEENTDTIKSYVFVPRSPVDE